MPPTNPIPHRPHAASPVLPASFPPPLPRRGIMALVGLYTLGFWCLSWLRLQLVDHAIGDYTGCTAHCFDHMVYGSDALVYSVALALVTLAWLLPRATKPLLALLSSGLLLAYAVDIFVFALLNHRLNLSDLLRYAGDVQLNGTVAWPLLSSARGLGLVGLTALCLATSLALIWHARPARRLGWWGLLLAPVLLGLQPPEDDVGHISADLYHDIISNNLPDGENQPYSAPFKQALARSPEPTTDCLAPDGPSRPVILVVVESLSLYHSRLMSGLSDSLPELDQVARRYAYLEHFHANGFTTDGGLIALLAGQVPLPNINRYQSVNAYLGFERPRFDAYRQLAQEGITPLYFRSADLGFIDTGDWLRELGFQHVEGPEHPHYEYLPRGSFNEPGDHALVERFLNWYDEERQGDRFFAVLQTTTTHPPFVIPGSDQRGEEAAFRYADHELAGLVRALELRNYFDRGLLVLTGDHRSMTVRRPGETRRLGPEAANSIPALLLGREFAGQGRIAGHWQQTDFLPSLMAVSGLPSCTSALAGRFLGPRVEPQVILHAEGLARDRVLVRLQGEPTPLEIQLDGDRTHWVHAPRSQPHLDVVTEVNRQRTLRPDAPANYVRTLLGWRRPAEL